MNLASGKFTAPRDGIYSFSFTGLALFPASSSANYFIELKMYLNGIIIGNGRADEAGTALQYETLSFQSTFNLQKGDQIWLQISYMSTEVYLHGNNFTHFNGYLIEENITS